MTRDNIKVVHKQVGNKFEFLATVNNGSELLSGQHSKRHIAIQRLVKKLSNNQLKD